MATLLASPQSRSLLSALEGRRERLWFEGRRESPLEARALAMPTPFVRNFTDLQLVCQHGAACPAADLSQQRQRLLKSPQAFLRDVEAGVHGACRLGRHNLSSVGDYHPGGRKYGSVLAQAMEATEEAVHEDGYRAKSWREPWQVSAFADDSPSPPLIVQQPLPLPQRNRADDLSLANPLQRLHRMGCGWLGVVFEWEGVIVEDDAHLERRAWAALAEEEKRLQPMAFVLKRAEGMKNQQAISEVLCWTREFQSVQRLAKRKEELYEEMQGGVYRVRPGSREFVETLKRYDIPIAVASTRPRQYLERAIEAVGLEGFFNVVVAADDVYRGKPDPEMFQYAAQQLGFITERCIVVGNSNATVEAAHDALMKVVAVAGLHPAFELGAADLVVRRLDDLAIVDLKNLADLDAPELQPPELVEMEAEEEAEVVLPKTMFRDDDSW